MILDENIVSSLDDKKEEVVSWYGDRSLVTE